jgi:hypothetical protein
MIAAAPTIDPNPLENVRTINGGKILYLGDAEDSPEFNIAFAPTVREAEELQEAVQVLCDRRTGVIISKEAREKMVQKRAEILRQSNAVAEKLETAGIVAYDRGEEKTWLFDPVRFAVDPHFGSHAEELPGFRRINFIPAVAQMRRRSLVKLLQLWLQEHPYARMWTFTTGERCAVQELRARISGLHRSVSKLNAAPFMSECGAKIVFRSTETGSLTDDDGNEVRNAAGEWLYHPHAHCFVDLTKGKIEGKRWVEMLQNIKGFMGANWDESGKIADAREAAKYPMKPADLDRLTPADVAALYEASRRLRWVETLGSLRMLQRDIASCNEALVWERDADEMRVGRVLNWNRRRPNEKQDKEDKALERILKHPGETDPEMRDCPAKAIVRLMPGAFFDEVTRPAIMVRACVFGLHEMRELMKEPHVRSLVEAALPAYLSALRLKEAAEKAAAPISVHNTHLTVRNAGNVDQAEMKPIVANPLCRSRQLRITPPFPALLDAAPNLALLQTDGKTGAAGLSRPRMPSV